MIGDPSDWVGLRIDFKTYLLVPSVHTSRTAPVVASQTIFRPWLMQSSVIGPVREEFSRCAVGITLHNVREDPRPILFVEVVNNLLLVKGDDSSLVISFQFGWNCRDQIYAQ